MSANLQKIRTALEASRLALGKVQCAKSVAWSLNEATVDFQPGHERELALIDEALAELDRAVADVHHEVDDVAGESHRSTAAD
ncbi:MAG: hypothetical protein JSR83_07360 [Proteobacteria bacterium]|nr:hypothetical protein [Pseudomonadota bacterium]